MCAHRRSASSRAMNIEAARQDETGLEGVMHDGVRIPRPAVDVACVNLGDDVVVRPLRLPIVRVPAEILHRAVRALSGSARAQCREPDGCRVSRLSTFSLAFELLLLRRPGPTRFASVIAIAHAIDTAHLVHGLLVPHDACASQRSKASQNRCGQAVRRMPGVRTSPLVSRTTSTPTNLAVRAKLRERQKTNSRRLDAACAGQAFGARLRRGSDALHAHALL